ncbi:hypothetical protein ANSO36C_08370 [Nostoc cf. commune SO-36]|uniref:Uncharacterized protein n=1 Tax=Nostoc cf. commune SO-36 TaxID=449208 RepID=A0ABN6PY88_NOSCO|nr:hypothetical protein ANSO36C_08370 [Nostoc cf. commune SO-36]
MDCPSPVKELVKLPSSKAGAGLFLDSTSVEDVPNWGSSKDIVFLSKKKVEDNIITTSYTDDIRVRIK